MHAVMNHPTGTGPPRHHRMHKKSKAAAAAAAGALDMCDVSGTCDMRHVQNVFTEEIQLHSLYVCTRCFRTHLCDLGSGCALVSTLEGSVCVKTGLVYEALYPVAREHLLEPIEETSLDDVNVIGAVLAEVYRYLMSHAARYADVIQEVVERDRLKKQVEENIYFTFNKVFRSMQNVNRISVPVISQLFTQLIIGIYSKQTKYDSCVIKVSRKKREDALLKQMRSEYGNAPVFGLGV
ncbi:Cy127 [Cynomolgus cytomegalovirus]|nr:Cy127 [Cynomolgus cytomegalovirus]